MNCFIEKVILGYALLCRVVAVTVHVTVMSRVNQVRSRINSYLNVNYECLRPSGRYHSSILLRKCSYSTVQAVNKAGQSRSSANLAITEGFDKSHSGACAFRIDIDASIWYQHCAHSKGGGPESPDLRLLLFHLCSLARLFYCFLILSGPR